MEVWVGLLVGWLSGLLGCLCLWWWCFFQQSYRIHQICLISSVSFTVSVVGFFSFTSDSFFFPPVFPDLSKASSHTRSLLRKPREHLGTLSRLLERVSSSCSCSWDLQLFLQLGSPAALLHVAAALLAPVSQVGPYSSAVIYDSIYIGGFRVKQHLKYRFS